MFKRFYVSVILLLIACRVFSQANYQFLHLDITDGLSENEINAVFKDAKGFIWIGTPTGLNRFDGRQIRVYKHDARDSTSLLDDYVEGVTAGPNNTMLVETRSGFVSYNPVTDSFEKWATRKWRDYGLPQGRLLATKAFGNIFLFYYEGKGLFLYDQLLKKSMIMDARGILTSLHSNQISDFAMDRSGNVWVIFEDGIIDKFNLKLKQVIKRYNYVAKISKAPKSAYFRLLIDNDGDLFFYNPQSPFGVIQFEPVTGKFTRYTQKTDDLGLNADIVTDIASNGKGGIWLGTERGGINILNKATKKFTYLKAGEGDSRGLQQNSINILYVDPSGIVWVGTYKRGLNFYHPKIFKFSLIRFVSKQFNLEENDINAFAEEKDGTIWIGTNGAGLIKYDKHHGKIRHYLNNSQDETSISSNIITNLVIDHTGRLWVGTYFGGLCYVNGDKFVRIRHDANKPASLSDDRISAMFEDSKKQLWVGTSGGGVEIIDVVTKKLNHLANFRAGTPSSLYITAIAEDSLKNIWIGTAWGLAKYDRCLRKITEQFSKEGVENSLISNEISALITDKSGLLWIGTRKGISILNTSNGNFTNLYKEKGLPENNILTLVEDDHSDIWFGSRSGLIKIGVVRKGSKLMFAYNRYDESDGLQSRRFNVGAAAKLRNGELLFGGPSGFNIFNPKNIRPFHYPATIILTDLEMLNHSIRVGEKVLGSVILQRSITDQNELNLKYNQNSFSLEVGLPDYFNSNNTYLQYRLNGFDKHWQNLDNKVRKARYTNLDPGNYVFQVTAYYGDKSTPVSHYQLKISIAPPLWKTGFAYFTYALIFCSAFYLIRRRGIRKLKREFAVEKELLRKEQERQQERNEEERLRELDRLKIKFLTNLSHEFRTPISLIMGPAEAISARIKDERNSEQLNLIKRNAKRLMNLVNQLLDFRQMEEKELKLYAEEGELISFIQDVSDSFTDLANRKKISFTFHSDIAELHTYFDHDKLERILFNLLSNAFKFTPGLGSINIEVFRLAASFSEKQTIAIKLHDTGIGIAEDQQANIFDRFFQADADPLILNQGNGIGLSITREFARLHGGEISVASKPGEGATFTVTIPFKIIDIVENSIDTNWAANNITQPDKAKTTDQLHVLTDRPAGDLPKPMLQLSDENLINAVAGYIEDNMQKPSLSVNDLSQHMGMSIESFHKRMLAVTGQAPVEYLLNFKLEKAARLLEWSKLSVSEVSNATGFTTPSYFAKIFKSKFGISPTDYAKSKRPNIGR
ncbi:helix-turn-helix domain-containing protein [Mucilaginibacter sp. UR6-1]|uniref:two-component regulator propeller domain-containing protein n=1 Tax=Mucilaginibacter sp. UR6-1 TaxID=1435643 RepID=UPI001E44C7AA|nr:two-component regulator propeller domain-containing protein [Mucilaginibacter sp. UR6-1]MCC8408577.1 helix-turn-helix domain-containing protein [Mucilaginibacter sp. UR6-1]